MNLLTLVKWIQNINAKEAAPNISDEASWHAKYKDSAYVYVGGVPFDLTEGDLLAVFAQYGEIVDVNLVRDKAIGKSMGFAFLAYEDQWSTNLAIENVNGAQILGRIIRVDHVIDYKKKEEEDEETLQRKREEHGFAVLSRGANAIREQDVNFHMMNRELQTQVGVMRRIEVQDGLMIDLMVQLGMANILVGLAVFPSLLLVVGATKTMRSSWCGRIRIKGREMNHMRVSRGMMN